MGKQLVLAEKPSVGRELARVLGCRRGGEGYLEGDRYVVTWALGHLVTLADPDVYEKKWEKWDMADLPMLPQHRKLVVIPQTARQFRVVQGLMKRGDITVRKILVERTHSLPDFKPGDKIKFITHANILMAYELDMDEVFDSLNSAESKAAQINKVTADVLADDAAEDAKKDGE